MNQADGELLIKFSYAIYSIAQFDHYIFCGGSKGELTVYNLQEKLIEQQIQFDGHAIFDIINWNGSYLLAKGNGYLTVLSKDWSQYHHLQVSSKSLRKLMVQNEELYITGSEGMIWRMNKNYEVLDTVLAHEMTIFAMEFNSQTNILYSGGRDALLKTWGNLQLIQTINAHWFHINCIALNSSQKYLATCSLDKTIKIWDAENNELLKVIDIEKYEAHQSSVNKILWIGINRFISCSDDRMIMCFEIQQK